MTAQELLDGIRAGREQLESIWAGLDEAQMARRPGPQSDWSVKDLIAHLTYWEQFTVDAVESSLSDGEPVPDPDTDAVNEQVLEANRNRSLSDIRVDFERSRREFEALVAKLSDEELNAMPRFKWEYEETLGELLASESYRHYAEHMSDLRAYVQQF
ncbi:MAG: ClbS/DfsB family four-helix bundle protein [Burkholderiales bacterium]|nr:ClbS/DfsB family four-helix bundle protein [Anaerolineae bacterium]